MNRRRALRVAAVSLASDGVFGVLMPVALYKLRQTGKLPMTPFGFRAYSGPFERLGNRGFAVMGFALVGVTAANVSAGILLWRDDRRGATLGLAASPASLALAAGFALPFLIVPIPIRALLIAWGRRELP